MGKEREVETALEKASYDKGRQAMLREVVEWVERHRGFWGIFIQDYKFSASDWEAQKKKWLGDSLSPLEQVAPSCIEQGMGD